MRAQDIMTRTVTTVGADQTVAEAARLMHATGHGGLPVLDAGGRVAGIIDRLTLVRLLLPRYAQDIGDLSFLPADFQPFETRIEGAARMLVREVMRPCDVCVSPQTPVVEIAAMMVTREVGHVPVVEEGRLVGLVGLQDIVDEIVWPHVRGADWKPAPPEGGG